MTGGEEPSGEGPYSRTWWYTQAGASGLWYYDYFMQQSLIKFLGNQIPNWCLVPVIGGMYVSRVVKGGLGGGDSWAEATGHAISNYNTYTPTFYAAPAAGLYLSGSQTEDPVTYQMGITAYKGLLRVKKNAVPDSDYVVGLLTQSTPDKKYADFGISYDVFKAHPRPAQGSQMWTKKDYLVTQIPTWSYFTWSASKIATFLRIPTSSLEPGDKDTDYLIELHNMDNLPLTSMIGPSGWPYTNRRSFYLYWAGGSSYKFFKTF